jgi:hypothetical protein
MPQSAQVVYRMLARVSRHSPNALNIDGSINAAVLQPPLEVVCVLCMRQLVLARVSKKIADARAVAV